MTHRDYPEGKENRESSAAPKGKQNIILEINKSASHTQRPHPQRFLLDAASRPPFSLHALGTANKVLMCSVDLFRELFNVGGKKDNSSLQI